MNNTHTNIDNEMNVSASMIGLMVMFFAVLLSCGLSMLLFSLNIIEHQTVGIMIIASISLSSCLGALISEVVTRMDKIDLTEYEELKPMLDAAVF
jgi:hypothetical protein